jgi:site-specific recombinase XerD
MEAMLMAGHFNIGSTKRYETKKYDELQELLKNLHPMEQADFTV